MDLSEIQPYIRYVNNYSGKYNYIQPKRIIYDFEFMYIMDGSITIFYNDQKYELHKSDLFYFEPNIENYMVLSEKKDLKTHCIHFDWVRPKPDEDFKAEDFYLNSILKPEHASRIPQLINRYTPPPADFNIPNYIPNLPYEKVAKLFVECYYSFILNSTASSLKLQAGFFNILSELAEIYSPDKASSFIHPKIIKSMEYIKEHYTEKIRTEELAKKHHMSPKYFGTVFKKTTGQSINNFVNNLRIFDAKQMLIGTDMSIERISEKLGFSNPFHFSKRFKEAEGLSPLQYRNMTR